MAYTTGTCTGHLALLAALKTFLESLGWVTKRYTTPGEYEFIAMGPGLSGEDEIYIGIQTYTDVANQCYNWKLRGFTGFSSSLDFTSQPGTLAQTGTYGPTLLLTSSTVQYWFIADTRRVIIIAKCGTSYESAYLGLILPYAPTSQLPYPLFIGGGHNGYAHTSTDQEFAHFAPWNPQSSDTGASQSWLLSGSVWQRIVNRGETSNYTDLNIWPFSGYPASEESPSTLDYQFWQIRENIDGSYPLFPLIIHSGVRATTKAIYGELSGVYAIPKWNQVAEDTFTIDSISYLVVPSAYRTSNRSYAAVKLA